MKIALSAPNNSMPISVHAMGVLVAPENTATKPMPANNAIGSGITQTNTLPSVAPIKNRGVTSPPLNPAPRVKVVKRSLSRKSKANWWFVNASTMVGMPKPMYLVVPKMNTAAAINTPPITGRQGG